MVSHPCHKGISSQPLNSPHSHLPALGFNNQAIKGGKSCFCYPVMEPHSKISFSKRVLNSAFHFGTENEELTVEDRSRNHFSLPRKELWLLSSLHYLIFQAFPQTLDSHPSPPLPLFKCNNSKEFHSTSGIIHPEGEIKRASSTR